MGFEVRKVRKTYKNLQIIERMDRLCFSGDDPMIYGHRKQEWWIVYFEEEPVAFGGARVWGEYLFLNRAGVLKSWRGHKLQQLLIRERSKTKLALITYTDHENEYSIKNLNNSGFHLWDPPKKYYVEGFLNWIKLPLDSEISF